MHSVHPYSSSLPPSLHGHHQSDPAMAPSQQMRLRRSADQTNAAVGQVANANFPPAGPTGPKTSFGFFKDAGGNYFKIELTIPDPQGTLICTATTAEWQKMGQALVDGRLMDHLDRDRNKTNTIETDAASKRCRINGQTIHSAPALVDSCWETIHSRQNEGPGGIYYKHEAAEQNRAPEAPNPGQAKTEAEELLNAHNSGTPAPAEVQQRAAELRDQLDQVEGNEELVERLDAIANPTEPKPQGGITKYSDVVAELKDPSKPVSGKSHIATLQMVNVLNGEKVNVISNKGVPFEFNGNGEGTLEKLLAENKNNEPKRITVIPIINGPNHSLLFHKGSNFYYYNPCGSGTDARIERLLAEKTVKYPKGNNTCQSAAQTSVYCANLLESVCESGEVKLETQLITLANKDKRAELARQGETYLDKLQEISSEFMDERSRPRTNMEAAKEALIGNPYEKIDIALQVPRTDLQLAPTLDDELDPTEGGTPVADNCFYAPISVDTLDYASHYSPNNAVIIGERHSNLEKMFSLRTPLKIEHDQSHAATKLPLIRRGVAENFKLNQTGIRHVDCVLTLPIGEGVNEGQIKEYVRYQARAALSGKSEVKDLHFEMPDYYNLSSSTGRTQIQKFYSEVLREPEFNGKIRGVFFLGKPEPVAPPPAPPSPVASGPVASSHAAGSPVSSASNATAPRQTDEYASQAFSPSVSHTPTPATSSPAYAVMPTPIYHHQTSRPQTASAAQAAYANNVSGQNHTLGHYFGSPDREGAKGMTEPSYSNASHAPFANHSHAASFMSHQPVQDTMRPQPTAHASAQPTHRMLTESQRAPVSAHPFATQNSLAPVNSSAAAAAPLQPRVQQQVTSAPVNYAGSSTAMPVFGSRAAASQVPQGRPFYTGRAATEAAIPGLLEAEEYPVNQLKTASRLKEEETGRALFQLNEELALLENQSKKASNLNSTQKQEIKLKSELFVESFNLIVQGIHDGVFTYTDQQQKQLAGIKAQYEQILTRVRQQNERMRSNL